MLRISAVRRRRGGGGGVEDGTSGVSGFLFWMSEVGVKYMAAVALAAFAVDDAMVILSVGRQRLYREDVSLMK